MLKSLLTDGAAEELQKSVLQWQLQKTKVTFKPSFAETTYLFWVPRPFLDFDKKCAISGARQRKKIIWCQIWRIRRYIHASTSMLTIMKSNHTIIGLFAEQMEFICRFVWPLCEGTGLQSILLLNHRENIPNSQILFWIIACRRGNLSLNHLQKMAVHTLSSEGYKDDGTASWLFCIRYRCPF